jgi:serine/threonine-protein kinase HipA
MPPFQMALPEGALLENLKARFGKLLDIDNDMVLLKLVGTNTIGRVRFTGADEALSASVRSEHSLSELLAHPETETLFRGLLERFGPSSGISGVQPKVLWTEYGKKVALVEGEHILKAAGRDYPGLGVNEFFCLRMAQAAGLTTPRFHLADNGELLVVERFDRNKDGRQLAFEEACALMHLPNHGKYRGSYEELADILFKVPCEPLMKTRRDLFKSILLSMVVRNGDAHLKNFGILYDDTSYKWQAPVYDVVSTIVYEPNDVPALTLAGKKAWPDFAELVDFGIHACGLQKKTVSQCLTEVRMGIDNIGPELAQYSERYPRWAELCERLQVICQSNSDWQG